MDVIKNQYSVTQWVNDYSDTLYGYVVQRVKDTHIAKDLVQDTFLAAWRNVDNYNGEASVKTWLFTILKNKIIDHYRKSSTRLTDELISRENSSDVFFDDTEHWAEGYYPKNWETNTSSKIESKEFYAILSKCKNKLKDIQSSVFSMKYLDDLSSDEICATLNITAANYWVIIHRAKVQLRTCLETNWFAA